MNASILSENRDFVLYDGDCPFCSAYIRMQRMRASGVNLILLDAREEPALVEHFGRLGLDINQGMILRLGGVTYFGGDVLHVFALMTGPAGAINRLLALIFSSRRTAQLLYPLLRAGRNATLRLLGRRKLEVPALR